jgi:N-acetylmuramoyl-L-alanine amidase
VRRSFILALLFLVAGASAPLAKQASPQPPAQQPSQQPPSEPAQPATPGAPPATQAAPPQAPPPPQHVLSAIVINPAHGGTDSGARGPGGVEKDLVLLMAKATRSELERQGFHVVITRDADQNPSFDDRAAIANAQRDAVYISFHVSSTGPVGTARAYSYRFSSTTNASATPTPAGVIPWDQAQKPYLELSRRFADLLQVQLAQKFRGSPELSASIPVRGLRSVAAPAVAVEISSVAATDPNKLGALIAPLSAAVARAVTDFKPIYEAGAK